MASKSAAVRELLSVNPKMKNVEIVKALEKKGIEIQAAQVSVVKKKFLESPGGSSTKKQPRRVRRRLERQTIKAVEGNNESDASTEDIVPAETPDVEVVTHTTTSAKASSVSALSTESLLKARRSFASFIKTLAEETGSTEVVDMLYSDIKKEINP